MEKVACRICGNMVLPTTSQKNDGCCALCVRGIFAEQCDVCQKAVNGVSKMPDGTKMCIRCNIESSKQMSKQWRELCQQTLERIDITTLKVKLFPAYNEVFVNNQCQGFYYPLCSLKFCNVGSEVEETVHIVSHNGLWFAQEGEPNNPYESFTVFEKVKDKYKFHGSLTNFSGWKYVQLLFQYLEEHYTSLINGCNSSDAFLQKVLNEYKGKLGDFDKEYYITTYYEFKKKRSKLKSDQFVPYTSISSEIFAPFTDTNFISVGEEIVDYRQERGIDWPIGVCWSESFFGDGNHVFLFLDEQQERAYLVNQYS